MDSILSEFHLFFGRIKDIIICFRDLLTFRGEEMMKRDENMYLPCFGGGSIDGIEIASEQSCSSEPSGTQLITPLHLSCMGIAYN